MFSRKLHARSFVKLVDRSLHAWRFATKSQTNATYMKLYNQWTIDSFMPEASQYLSKGHSVHEALQKNVNQHIRASSFANKRQPNTSCVKLCFTSNRQSKTSCAEHGKNCQAAGSRIKRCKQFSVKNSVHEALQKWSTEGFMHGSS